MYKSYLLFFGLVFLLYVNFLYCGVKKQSVFSTPNYFASRTSEMPTPDAYIVQFCALPPTNVHISPHFPPIFPAQDAVGITHFGVKTVSGEGGEGGVRVRGFCTPVHEVMRGFGAESTEKYIV